MTHDMKPDIEHDADDPLVQAVLAESEFAAQTKAAVLHEEGIEAFVFPAERAWTGGLAIAPSGMGVPVWVKQSDLDRAKSALNQRIADSVDLDWNEVDVGEAESNDTTSPPEATVVTVLVRAGFAIAVAIVALAIYVAIVAVM